MGIFNELGLDGRIVKAIEEMGFEKPTPIQEKTIPYIVGSTNDLIALAQTGTGKTAAFGLPVIQMVDGEVNDIQALALCPTRELCIQISKDLTAYSKYLGKFNVIPVYGGASIDTQIKALKKGGQIVVGTPGRVLDLIKRKKLKIEKIKWLVLDEADEMLNMGFQEDLDAILANTPKEKQTLLFSATMPGDIRKMTKKYMTNPEELTVGQRNSGAENVRHEFYMVQARDRFEALKRLADINPNIYGIIFCRTRAETKDVADKLIKSGYNADALHGDLSQAQRDFVMHRFRERALQLLVATDVAARGLDVNDLTHVINYNLPDDMEAYVHRSGRTGRAGKNGVSMSIIHTREMNKIRDLERMNNIRFEHKQVPDGRDICGKQLFKLIDRMENVEIDHKQIEPFLDEVYKKLEWLSREDLIQRFVSVEFNRFLSYYKDAPDLNVKAKKEKGGARNEKGVARNEKGRQQSNTEFTRYFINLGSKNGVNPPKLIAMLNQSMKNNRFEIGRIDIMKKFAFFELPKGMEKDVTLAFKNMVVDNEKIVVQIAKDAGKPGGDRFREKRPAKRRRR